jgi:hypothetical protein
MELVRDDERIGTMTFREITREFGEQGLRQRFAIEVDRAPWSEEDKQAAIEAARFICDTVHAGFTRDDDTEATHVLRVTTRVMSPDHFDYSHDPVIVRGLLHHDGVEDHPERYLNEDPLNPDDMSAENLIALKAQRQRALEVIARTDCQEVADMTASMLNDIYDKTGLTTEQKHYHYRESSRIRSFEAGDREGIGKLSDFLDNCLGLEFNPDHKLRLKLASKYKPQIPTVLQFVLRSNLSEKAKKKIIDELFYANELCNLILADTLPIYDPEHRAPAHESRRLGEFTTGRVVDTVRSAS